MDLEIPYSHTSSKEEAYKVASEKITPDSLAQGKIRAELSFKENESILATGKGFRVELHFKDLKVQVSCKLSLILRPFKGEILERVKDKLKEYI